MPANRKRYALIDSSDDDSDEDLVELEARAIALNARLARKKAKRASKEGNLKQNLELNLSLENTKLAKLENIADPTNRRLQQLLWELNCDFDLFEHQFVGVRAVAGLSATFPESSMITASQDENQKLQARLGALEAAKPRRDGEDRGLILADVMGLGKTVQAVCAVRLCNAVAHAKGQYPKPSIIVCPNDAVMTQWEEHLLRAGVEPEAIIRFQTKKTRPLDRGAVYLCTRYDLQTEARFILESYAPEDQDLFRRVTKQHKKSPLFPHASELVLTVFQNQYKSSNSNEANRYNEIERGQKILTDEVIVRYLWGEENRLSAGRQDEVFRLVIVDEAHFLKNLKTYWGMAASLIGLHSERMVPLTGTPFNNSCQDLATLMTFIKPSDGAARLDWWKSVTAARTGPKVKALASKWQMQYLVRREKDIIAHLLPKKTIQKKEVQEKDLLTYTMFEECMIDALKRVHSIEMSNDLWGLKEAMEAVLGCASCMQLSLLHPILPKGGRQLTVLFSPSLRNNKAVKKKLENSSKCVCCNRWVKLAHKKKRRSEEAALDLDNLENDFDEEIDDINDRFERRQRSEQVDGNDSDSDIFRYEDDERRPSNEPKGYGDIVPIPSELCQFSQEGIRHFACESCLEELEDCDQDCPMCSDLFGRLKLSKLTSKANADARTGKRQVYCQDVHGGFVPSAKLETVLNDFKTDVPVDDKVAVVSFFKGSLDLLEVMLQEHGIEIARFDGDIKADERQKQLEKFKTKASCRVLLMTAQTGGTGLNIVEANHVWFMERYWNPMVLQQCEDRTYRIGQKKDVDIRYYDIPLTFDDVLNYITKHKKDNAAIVLSDSVALQDGRVNYRDLTGFVSNALEALSKARKAGEEASAKETLDNVIAQMVGTNERLPAFLANQNQDEGTQDGMAQLEDQPLPDDQTMVNDEEGSQEDSSDEEVEFSDSDYPVTVTGWKCGTCDYFNTNEATSCKLCNNKLSSPAAVSSGALDSDSIAPSEEQEDWACGLCTFINEGDDDTCEVCEAPRKYGVIDLSND